MDLYLLRAKLRSAYKEFKESTELLVADGVLSQDQYNVMLKGYLICLQDISDSSYVDFNFR